MLNFTMLAQQFYNTLTAEVIGNVLGLRYTQCQELRRYYHALANNPRRRPFYRYSWVRRTAPMVRLLMLLPKRNVPWRVLDAGCGVGTESIFWSTLRDDIEVTGVDINVERLNTAKARQTGYENRLRKPLNMRFLEQDVFSVLSVEHFDLVWVMEAISHIDPAESFLTSVSENLGSAGYLVISDSHLLNPTMAWRTYKLRQRGIATYTYKPTSTGETISYARERLFTVGRLSKMLKWAGFQSVQTQLSIFFPPALAYSSLLFRLCIKCDYVLNRIPLLRHLGGIYTAVASK
jgi:2-polyprenyl-3-methyl-5-hydroxy-6-metoxy-1,4-benzoquinol methylase